MLDDERIREILSESPKTIEEIVSENKGKDDVEILTAIADERIKYFERKAQLMPNNSIPFAVRWIKIKSKIILLRAGSNYK